jgi:hypothetical protein
VTLKLTQLQVDSDFRQQLILTVPDKGGAFLLFILPYLNIVVLKVSDASSISPFCFSPGVSLTLQGWDISSDFQCIAESAAKA